MKNYEKMSDNELNTMVADLRGGYAGNVHGSKSMVKVKGPESHGLFYMEVDYCNNISDAWPIIMENKIWIQPDMIGDGFWHCYDCENQHFSKHKKPLRAAMIVFLMMRKEQKS